MTKMKILDMMPVEGDHFICGRRENRMKLGSILGEQVLERGLGFIENFIVFHGS